MPARRVGRTVAPASERTRDQVVTTQQLRWN